MPSTRRLLIFFSFDLVVILILFPNISVWLRRFATRFMMPALTESANKTHFKTTQKLTVEFSPHELTEYVSSRTGMRVVIVDQKGPKVFGTFAAATEIFDDSGSPHTLEHLCFMGSKSHPYKGILDQLATRAYSTTNAWTATDHTAYTLESAGYAAFVKILPIYLDHVILPTLTDAGCYTEVFHIDATGHDTGVVYSEMQGVQNNQAEIMELVSKRLMYPEGIGFRYETGGMMEQLRVLTAERIRKFHRDMYQPKNLCLIIVGEIEHDHLLQTLDDFENSILEFIPSPNDPFRRPFLESKQPPALEKTIIESVDFPEEDESVGELNVRYFGPSCNNQVEFTAINILLSYLASNSASVLENVLVEKEQVCTAVYYQNTPRPDSVIEFTLTGVETASLEKVKDRFFALLNEVASSELDLTYIHDCIDRERRQQMFSAESSDQWFVSAIISTFLFSQDRDLADLATMNEFDQLMKWTEPQWRDYLKKWIVDAHSIIVLGKPSNALSEKLKEEETARVEEQKKKLGEKGLKELEEKLKRAREENDKPIPKEILHGFKVPPTDTIHFVSTTPARTGRARDAGRFDNDIQHLVDRDDSDIPLYLHYEDMPSNFVHMYILLGTGSIPVKLRPLIPIYIENFFTSPVVRDGKRVEFEEVVKALDRDTVGYGLSTANRLGNGEVLSLSFQVEIEKYNLAVSWIKDLLWNSPFDVERLQAITSRLLQDVPDEKRSGNDMVSAVSNMVQETPESISRAGQTLVKALYLKRVKKLLKTEPESIVKQCEELRGSLCKANNMRILVTTDIRKLKSPVSAWKILAEGADSNEPLAPLDRRLDRLTEIGQNPGNHVYVVPMATIDSSFVLASARGPEDPKDLRVPALMVAISYLDAVEGPLWTSVRGAGLAYGTGFRRRPGHIEFSVYRSPDSFKAFSASKQVLDDYISGVRKLDDLAMEGAVSSIVLGIADGQSTMASAAMDNVIRTVMKDLPRDWNEMILEKVRNVTMDEVIKAMKDMLLPVFEPETSNLFVTCGTIMEEGLVKGLTELGYKPEVRTLASFQDDYGLKAGDDEEEESDGGSEEGSDMETGSESDAN